MGEWFEELQQPETYQALLAEAVGTGLLTLAALLAGTPYAVALILAALVYALGPVSGAQLNPAVTLGLLASRKVSPLKGALYLAAQVTGALLARRVAPALGDLSGYHAGQPIGEFVGAGLLVLAVAAVVAKKVPKEAGGVTIGAALGAGLLLSGGVLNPAVALAMGLGLSPAVWAAALGGIAFAALFDLLTVEQGEQQRHHPGGTDRRAPARPAPARSTLLAPARSVGGDVTPEMLLAADPVAAAQRRHAATPRSAAQPGSNPRKRAQPPIVGASSGHGVWSSIFGLLTLPFALAGLVLRIRRTTAHQAAPAAQSRALVQRHRDRSA